MSLIDDIRRAQVNEAEDAVIRRLEACGLIDRRSATATVTDIRDRKIASQDDLSTVPASGLIHDVMQLNADLHASNEALMCDVLDMRAVMQCMVAGIKHLAEISRQWEPLTKTAQVRMCGNSVSPPVAAALVRANLAELAIRRAA